MGRSEILSSQTTVITICQIDVELISKMQAAGCYCWAADRKGEKAGRVISVPTGKLGKKMRGRPLGRTV